MANLVPTQLTTVLIAIGPEWAPIRTIVASWLTSVGTESAYDVASLSDRERSPDGRVALWLANASGGRVLVPGSGRLPELAGKVAGVTELLLDPDPFQAEQLYALGIWTRFASRLDRLKMRISASLEDDIVTNAVLANPQLAAVVGEWQGNRVVIIGQDLIAVEVTARAFRAIAQPAGDVGLSPWQAPLVQAAIERGMGVVGGYQMAVALQTGSPVDPRIAEEAKQLVQRISQLLDTTLT